MQNMSYSLYKQQRPRSDCTLAPLLSTFTCKVLRLGLLSVLSQTGLELAVSHYILKDTFLLQRSSYYFSSKQ